MLSIYDLSVYAGRNVPTIVPETAPLDRFESVLAGRTGALGRNPERSGLFLNPTCLQAVEAAEISDLGWIAIVRSRAHNSSRQTHPSPVPAFIGR
jgi:hypothetical protein